MVQQGDIMVYYNGISLDMIMPSFMSKEIRHKWIDLYLEMNEEDRHKMTNLSKDYDRCLRAIYGDKW